jgi:hypothetical protein
MRWRIATPLLMGFACQLQSASAASLAKSSAEINYDLAGKGPIRWSGGALSAVEGQSGFLPVVRLFGRDGIQLAALAVAIPEAKIVAVHSVARGRNGLVAMAGSAGDSEGRTTGFIALYPPDGSARKVIPIPFEVYSPIAIALAEDGSAWTAGIPGKHAPGHNVFWHFDPLGTKTGSAVDLNSFSGPLAIPGGLFAASPRGLVWISPKDGRYLELSLDGVVTTDIAVNFPSASLISGLAVTEDGQTFVQVQTRQPFQITICSIDKKSGDLTVVVKSPEFYLLGAEGNTLMGHAKTRIVSANILP